ncbi:hypothetical protein BH09ACT12_BH09ACT12_01460 [soil metagenome]
MTSGHSEHPGQEGTFGDAAAEMPNETEVEAPLPADAGEGGPTDVVDAVDAAEEISGVSNWIEEGGPLEPSDTHAPGGVDDNTDTAELDELTVTSMALEERTRDLQRLQAEFLNYKRRVERDRDLIKQNATYAALAPITEVLDTIDRAREHGELDGGLKTVADQLERTVASSGLVKFGEPGEAFDPTVHEALTSMGPDAEVTVTTVKVVAKSGYKIGDRVVRAAQVLTVEPDGG